MFAKEHIRKSTPKSGKIALLINSLATRTALDHVAELESYYEESNDLETVKQMQAARFYVLGAFSEKGVKFDKKGNPRIPAMVLSASSAPDLEKLNALALCEAYIVLYNAEFALYGDAVRYIQTPITLTLYQLRDDAVAAGAYDQHWLIDPTTNERKETVIKAFYCEPKTLKPIQRV